MFQEVVQFIFFSRVMELFVPVMLGFGLAVILQSYIKKNSYIPLWVGWTLFIFAIVVYVLTYAAVRYGMRFL